MKIAFLDAATMGDVSFEPIARLGDFVKYDTSTPEQARERVKDLDVLIINKIIVDKIFGRKDHGERFREIYEGTSIDDIEDISVDDVSECIDLRACILYTEGEAKVSNIVTLQKYENETLFTMPLYYQPVFLIESNRLETGITEYGNPQFNYDWNIQNWKIN